MKKQIIKWKMKLMIKQNQNQIKILEIYLRNDWYFNKYDKKELK